jgi:superfamily II DNA or RNA helicase
MLRDRFGQRARVVTSDDPEASERIAAFAGSDDAWLVSVRMVSEGVDIPRLRVGVYATTTTTELFFRQAVGRLVRWTPGVPDQKAYLFIPDDPRLRARAFQIAEQRRHSLRKRSQERFERDPAALDTGAEEQLSLFAALSAVATDHDTHAPFSSADDVDDDLDPGLDDDPSLVLALAPPPPLAGRRGLDDLGIELGGAAARTRREEKRRLREQNAEIVATLVRRTGQSHAQLNAELNRLAGIGRITEATVAQLRTRLEVAERMARR